MVDITHKSVSHRKAIAQAIVCTSATDTILAIKEGRVPKGDVFSMAKAAGLFAAKRTSDMIPDCHPLPIEYTEIRYNIIDLQIFIEVEIHTIYKTGVEVEAMHAASVVALTMYDMLKPLDKKIEIHSIKLLEKKGGKTDIFYNENNVINTAVIVCSDSVFAGKKEDKSGKIIIEKLKKYNCQVTQYFVVPDEVIAIQESVKKLCVEGCQMIILTGGTGLSPRDITPEAIEALLDREVKGISETIRNYGQQRMSYAMLSRSIAGIIGQTLVITMPGSSRGAAESVDAIFPQVTHIFKMMRGASHD